MWLGEAGHGWVTVAVGSQLGYPATRQSAGMQPHGGHDLGQAEQDVSAEHHRDDQHVTSVQPSASTPKITLARSASVMAVRWSAMPHWAARIRPATMIALMPVMMAIASIVMPSQAATGIPAASRATPAAAADPHRNIPRSASRWTPQVAGVGLPRLLRRCGPGRRTRPGSSAPETGPRRGTRGRGFGHAGH
jgi:hypothetical protein